MTSLEQGLLAGTIRTEYGRATVGVQPRPLGKGKIVGVIVQNTFFNFDGPPITANNIVVMVGDDSAQVVEILPGVITQTVFYADDLEDVYARVQSGTTEVDVSLVVYKEK